MKRVKFFVYFAILITVFLFGIASVYNQYGMDRKEVIELSEEEKESEEETEGKMEVEEQVKAEEGIEDIKVIEENTETTKTNVWVIWILPIIGVLVGAFLKFIGEYLVGFLTYYFGRMRIRKLPKKWRTTWSYSDKDESEEGEDTLVISQIGTYIRGKTISNIHNYSIKGRLHSDGTIQGIWKTYWPGKNWYGTFHMLADLDAETIKGMWIGKLGKDPGKVRGGRWIWEEFKG